MFSFGWKRETPTLKVLRLEVIWPNYSTVILVLRKDGVNALLAAPGGPLPGRQEMNRIPSHTCCGSINQARAEASVIPNASSGQLARAGGPPVSDPLIFGVISEINDAITAFKTLGSLGSKNLT
ncbi:hypothetical protein llap_2344 [Limosa lapponica baueri]|uniref:Uncharacterized protein n=1 Tax=Limosa lapponica baueri TaxID=1758121 RepID=A0A2I0UMV8_LIMLA|nr:hypothetical protein llap_2344 [Limosa lapponica baueri]